MFYLKLKSGISPVVATALLLVVAVVSVVGFQGWFSDFSSKVLVDVEEDSSSSFNSVKVEGIINDVLYLNSKGNSELSLLSVIDSNGALQCSFSGTDEVNNSGLVGHWKFDDESSIISDYSGNGNDGKLYGDSLLILDFDDGTANDKTSYLVNGQVNNALIDSSDCVSGSCVSFDGFNDSVDFTGYFDELDLSGKGEFSISYWVKFNEFGTGNIISNGREWSDTGYIISFNNNKKFTFMIGNDTIHHKFDTNYILPNGTWNNYVFTFDNGTLSFFVDGVLHSNYLTNFTHYSPDSYPMRIGAHGTSTNSLNGSIDEFGLYSKALSQSEITSMYNSRKVGFVEFTNSGLEFDGVDDYVEIIGSENMDFSSNYSIMISYKNKNLKSSSTLVSKTYTNDSVSNLKNTSFALDILDSEPRFFMYSSDDLKPYGNLYHGQKKVFSDNKNSYTVVSYDPSVGMNMFYDGEFIDFYSKYNLSYISNIETVKFGARLVGDSRFFQGEIDEIRIYEKILNISEVNLLSSPSLDLFENLNKIDLSSCNLDKGNKYGVVGFSGNNKIDVEVIAK